MKFLRPQPPANQTLSPRDDITARSQARNPFSFGRRLLTAGIIAVSLTFTPRIAGGEQGKQPVKQETKVAQEKAEAQATMRAYRIEDFGFEKGKTSLDEVLSALKERGLTGIVISTTELAGEVLQVAIAADGLLNILYFGPNKILRADLPFDELIKPGTIPKGWAMMMPPVLNCTEFITAENLYLTYKGGYEIGILIARIKDVYKPVTIENLEMKVLPLREAIERNGTGFRKPKFIYIETEKIVVLTAEGWNEVVGMDAETGEPIGYAPAEILKPFLNK